MANQPVRGAASQRFSFRRLIRYSIVLQVVMVALLVGVTLWGALQARSRSDDLARETRNVLFLTGQGQEFQRARLAMRQYASSGRQFSIGAFEQSKGQIETIAIVLQSGLSGSAADRARELMSMQIAYLEDVGETAFALARAGDRRAAQASITSASANSKLEAVQEASTALASEMASRQEAADQAVSRGQGFSALLIVLSGLLMLGTGVGILLWVRSQTLVPLESLAVASRRLGHGDLSARVEVGGVEEIALTGSAFNQMADEIERHVGQLHDLTLARSRFVSSVSHELRTPITSLRGYLDLLAQGEAGELAPDQLRFVEVAERNAHQLSDLIDDLLTLSRVQSGRLNLREANINLRDLLLEVKTEMLPIGAERGIDIVLVDTGDLIVQGDALRLRQAFGNLLGNAIKYSRDGQAVVVRALAVDRQVVVSFVDWGVGIPREDLPQIAEPFFRSEANEGVPGTGLGLAIAKQMIELHGGRLAVESEFGRGSTFSVYLPLELATEEPADAVPAAPSATTSTDRDPVD